MSERAREREREREIDRETQPLTQETPTISLSHKKARRSQSLETRERGTPTLCLSVGLAAHERDTFAASRNTRERPALTLTHTREREGGREGERERERARARERERQRQRQRQRTTLSLSHERVTPPRSASRGSDATQACRGWYRGASLIRNSTPP